jgi:hypothetical protein
MCVCACAPLTGVTLQLQDLSDEDWAAFDGQLFSKGRAAEAQPGQFEVGAFCRLCVVCSRRNACAAGPPHFTTPPSHARAHTPQHMPCT